MSSTQLENQQSTELLQSNEFEQLINKEFNNKATILFKLY